MTNDPAAVIFDFDGLICDTELPEYLAWQEIFESFGARLAFETWAQCIGTQESGFDIYEELARTIRWPFDRETIRTRKNARYQALLGDLRPLPGITDWIGDARSAGLSIGIASSSGHAWVESHLDRLGLLDQFDTICCREDVPRTKPEPWLYLLAAERLGVARSSAIALEDSPNGVLAAKRAGRYCIAVPNTLTRLLTFEGADLTVDSLANVRLADVARRWPRPPNTRR